jgi:hypothetical protein
LKTEADFVIYTSPSEINNLQEKFISQNSNQLIRFIEYDLFKHPYHNYFQEKMNNVKTDRCNEVMHGKFIWMKNHLHENYDYIYWIDCGLSYGGLFPNKYIDGVGFNSYFNCTLFNPKLVSGLNSLDKIVIIVATQEKHIMDSSPNPNFYLTNPKNITSHVIGGLFGGDVELLKIFLLNYENAINEMVQFGGLDREEHLLTLLYDRHTEIFNPQFFTTWHHEDSDMAKYNFQDEIYFYNIFEKLNN